jgi:ATP-binding cassette subfamily B protein
VSISELNSNLQTIRVLLRVCYQADRKKTLLAFSPIVPLTTGVSAVSLRELLDAMHHHRQLTIALAALAFGLAFLLNVTIGRVANSSRLKAGEALGREIDRQVMVLMAKIRHLERLEDQEFLDNVEVLRRDRGAVIQGPRVTGWLVDGGGGLVVSLLLLIWVEPILAILPIAMIPTVLLAGRAQRLIDRASQDAATRSRKALYIYELATSPQSAKELRVFGLQAELMHRHANEWHTYDATLLSAESKAALLRTMATFGTACVAGFALWILANGVTSGRVGAGDLYIALSVTTLLVNQIMGTSSGLGSIRRSVAVGRKFVWLRELANGYDQSESLLPRVTSTEVVAGLSLRGISFSYPGQTTRVLSEISLEIPRGSVLAVVGENGAGKSTLVKLLLGLYAPTEGSISLDGVNLADLNADSIRAKQSACFQDFAQLCFVLRESIGVGDAERIDDEEAVSKALEHAGAIELRTQWPLGLETQLGVSFGGPDPSQGQWQKVAISRAMMRSRPMIVTLDEPTRAIDPLAEHRLFEKYGLAARRLAEETGTIMILVSHRFSTVRMADQIVVLDGGQIVERGSHERLMRMTSGTYREMFTLQASQYV